MVALLGSNKLDLFGGTKLTVTSWIKRAVDLKQTMFRDRIKVEKNMTFMICIMGNLYQTKARFCNRYLVNVSQGHLAPGNYNI